ncbi:tripartite tricarboxylate transporter substrate binding protein [Pusillimonas sp. TS35]|uniref:Bug family tripartite tricarboxylate transporter substrate binding protein n=1 Tax=Paracandidimonas lactea TaxID=2895524 RepID=UPI00136CD329|nr:tripartite tricarboxylate transporter substrate binding protein [Paracandidimonas lactea]MYN13465.1 tripartite tricarboxylate transporter substrate binding protein [Pusillimonas sp. TS35]
MSNILTFRRLDRRQFLVAATLFATGVVHGKERWPGGKTITWVVPYPPGGSTDVLGRAITRQLDAFLDTTVVVENRPGATGTIGAARVARSEPDGLTILGTSIGPQAIAPHIMGHLPYDPIASFAPVITVGTIPHILVVGAKLPYESVKDLITQAKANPNQIAFASGGTGTILHMQGELLQHQTGARFIHVPYKGDTPALQDTLGGQVQFMFAPAAAALPHIQNGSLRALAVTAAQRLSALSDVPTMTELGFSDFVVEQWQAVFVPVKTPPLVIQKLNGAIGKALQTPDLKTLAEKLGITLVGGSTQELDNRRRADYAKWGKLIRDAGIKR